MFIAGRRGDDGDAAIVTFNYRIEKGKKQWVIFIVGHEYSG